MKWDPDSFQNVQERLWNACHLHLHIQCGATQRRHSLKTITSFKLTDKTFISTFRATLVTYCKNILYIDMYRIPKTQFSRMSFGFTASAVMLNKHFFNVSYPHQCNIAIYTLHHRPMKASRSKHKSDYILSDCTGMPFSNDVNFPAGVLIFSQATIGLNHHIFLMRIWFRQLTYLQDSFLK